MHFYQALQRNASILSNNIATSFGNTKRTWKEVEQRVSQLAGSLVKQGIDSRENIAILSLNSDRYFEYLNAWKFSLFISYRLS